MEKIALLNISWKRAIEDIMLFAMAGCGAFLFALMSATEPDEILVLTVGYTGIVACVTTIIFEIYTVTRVRERRKTMSTRGLQQPVPVSTEFVDGCSYWFVALGFLLASSFTPLMVLYAITLEDWYSNIALMILPIVVTFGVISMMLRPKDEGLGIIALHSQFTIFSFGLGVGALGYHRNGNRMYRASSITVLISVLIAYALGLQLRRKAAQLPPAQLSSYICNTVLLGGVSAMAPMLFFTFEAVSCIASNGIESNECDNTMHASNLLSDYLVLFTTASIFSKAVVREQRGEVSLGRREVANFDVILNSANITSLVAADLQGPRQPEAQVEAEDPRGTWTDHSDLRHVPLQRLGRSGKTQH